MQSNPNRQQLQACNPTRARPEKRPHRGVELPCTPGDSGSDLEQKKRHVSVCVQGQHVQLQCSCVNEQHRAFSHYHSTPFFLTPPHLNSCCHPPLPTHSPSKSLLSHYCGNWWCGGPGLGGRVGKTLQTRHEQMPETLDCRADHRGRTSH